MYRRLGQFEDKSLLGQAKEPTLLTIHFTTYLPDAFQNMIIRKSLLCCGIWNNVLKNILINTMNHFLSFHISSIYLCSGNRSRNFLGKIDSPVVTTLTSTAGSTVRFWSWYPQAVQKKRGEKKSNSLCNFSKITLSPYFCTMSDFILPSSLLWELEKNFVSSFI